MSIASRGMKAVHPRSVIGRLKNLRKNENGFTAVEFAMVVGPFIALLFGIIEVALVYFATFTLENAVEQAARMIRTGQIQMGGFSASAFKTKVCDQAAGFMDCNKLRVDVRSFGTFGGVTPPNAFDANGNLKANFEQFSAGNGGDVVLVTVYYEWDLVAKIPGVGLGNMPSGARLIQASVAFKNEPFDN